MNQGLLVRRFVWPREARKVFKHVVPVPQLQLYCAWRRTVENRDPKPV
jgi:hypothetical protein